MERRPHKGPLLGVAFGLGSFALSFAQLRPNRIASGTGIPVWEALHPFELALLCLPLLLCLALALKRGAVSGCAGVRCISGPEGPAGPRGPGAPSGPSTRSVLPLACGLSGTFLVCLVFHLSGRVARALVPPDAPHARVSMGFGAWLMILAGYVLVLFALEDRTLRTRERVILSLAGPVAVLALFSTDRLAGISVLREYAARKDRFLEEFVGHLLIAGASVGAAVTIGVPLGVLAFRSKAAARPVFLAVNTVQSVPSLALFGILIAPLAYLSRRFPLLRELGVGGVGPAPALVALTLYALLPIVRNTYAGLKTIDPGVREAGRGMGMGRAQLLFRVEIPVSLPVIVSGIRISLVQAIGNTTVAALIGAGGLGVFVFQGLGQAVSDLILLGVLPVILLAVSIDRVMQAFVRLLTPRGLSVREGETG